MKLLPWPSQSPELNSIGTLWDELKWRMHKTGPRTLNDQEKFYKDEWSQIPCSVFSNLIRCYRRRLSAGKGRLDKVLNAGVPISVAHVVLLYIYILLLYI